MPDDVARPRILARRPLARALLAASLLLMAGGVTAVAAPTGVERTDLAAGTTDRPIDIRTTEPTDIRVRVVRIAPGGSTGWHRHPGWETVVIKTGTVAYLDEREPGCAVRTLTPGQALVIPGDVAHDVRNAGAEPVEAYVTAYLLAGAPGVIEAAEPPACA